MGSDIKQDFSCGVIPYRVVNGVRQFLLIQHNAGHWAFPKGHPDEGETHLETARRELAEETGIDRVTLDEDRPFEEHYAFTKKGGRRVQKTVVYFVGEVDADKPVTLQQAEVSDHVWADAPGARERMTFEEGRSLLDTVVAYLG